ncbi:MAG TPA: LD-carboxypeptidase [Caulobacteraceae bacterium]|jgi:muramoyltetrapeptide carboxypeptidase|nr:LD-carboxypeptidase [Caulobacteraceae bacterium]
MSAAPVTIAVVAPGSRALTEVAERVTQLAAELYPAGEARLVFHPQCFASSGHFAGDDATRAAALVEVGDDPTYDAVWFARGGYGAGRLIETVLPQLGPAARAKTWLGYSDGGALLGAFYGAGFPRIAHGPVVHDVLREGGEAAVTRALRWLVERDPATLEPSLAADRRPAAAFNLTMLSTLVGTPWQPDLAGHVLMLEEVSEYMYAIDRRLFHVTSNAAIRRVAGLRLGRCSLIPDNDPAFGQTDEQVARAWCERAAIPWLGRADIGHDAANRIVPFGAR